MELIEYVTEVFKDNFLFMKNWEATFPCLERSEVEHLEVPFSDEVISRELMGGDGNKAPGSDRFTFKVDQSFWPDLREKLVPLFNHFFRH